MCFFIVGSLFWVSEKSNHFFVLILLAFTIIFLIVGVYQINT